MKNPKVSVWVLGILCLALMYVGWVQNNTIMQQRTEMMNQLQTLTSSEMRQGKLVQQLQSMSLTCKK